MFNLGTLYSTYPTENISFIHSKTPIDILTSIVLFVFYAFDCVNLTLMLTRRSEGP